MAKTEDEVHPPGREVIDQAAVIARLSVLEVRDGDVIVLRIPESLSSEARELARQVALAVGELHAALPVLVLPDDMVIGALPLRTPREPRT